MRTSFIENHSNYRVIHHPHVENFDTESNIENININNHGIQHNSNRGSNRVQSKAVSESKRDDDSISKWQKPKTPTPTELSDDQLLTKVQMEKKMT
jgi:allophanate hydrolase subunit 2